MILACLIRFPDRFWRFGEIIKPEYFNGPSAVETVFRLMEYVNKYGKYPEFKTLGNYVFAKTERKNPDRAKELIEYIVKLSTTSTSDVDAIFDLTLGFAKERALLDALRKIHLAQQEGSKETIDPVAVVEQAMRVGFDYEDLGIELRRDLEKVIDKVSQIDYGVHTGYTELDNIWRYGWPAGWLIVPLAPPKSFKTTFCLNLAYKMASCEAINADVMYYACEITQELAMMRTIFNMSGRGQNELYEGREKFKIAARQAADKNLWGHVWYKGFPSKVVTISQIKAHARMVMTHYNIKPKAIFIDYAETVRPSNTAKNIPDWRQQADIYTEARAMGQELGCCIIMPDRCNADTVGRKVPSMKSFQGSFEKAGVVDVAIGLCMTEAERKHNNMRFFIFLNRHGEQYDYFQGKLHPERMGITIDKKIEYNPDEEEEEEKSQFRSGKSKIRTRIARELLPNGDATQE